MALWGDKDRKTTGSTGTITIDYSGTVTGTNTLFTTQGATGNYIVIASTNTSYLITSITSNIACTVQYGITGATMVAVSGATGYFFSEKPIYVATAECDGSTGIHGDANKVYGVDVTEAGVAANRAKGLNTPGWVRYNTYTDSSGTTRYKSEVLVAMTTIAGDADDDSILPDS